VAEFVKQQAVVKFNLTNRKNPVEDLEVESFRGYGILPGTETPFGIYVEPKVSTNEMFVAIPYVKNMEIVFEAYGVDGYNYRLIVPSVSFEDGLYYRRTLNMKRLAAVMAPVAKTGLIYTSQPLALVDPAHIYWEVNGEQVILDEDMDYQEQKCVISYFVKKEVTAGTIPAAPSANENGWMTSVPTEIHAGTYYVWTKMTGNYDYEDVDVCQNPEKVVIAKADATLNASATSSNLVYNVNSQSLLATAATLTIGANNVTSAKDASNNGCTIQYYVTTSNTTPGGSVSWGSSYSATNANTYYVWVKVTGNGDIKDIAQVLKATKAINPKVVTSPAINWTGGPYTYNGSAKQPTVTAVKDGNVTVSSNEYNVGYQNNTNAGTATIVISDKTGGNYTISGSTTFTISRASGYVHTDSPNASMNEDDIRYLNITSSHGGQITYTLSGETSYYDVTYQSSYNRIKVRRKINDDYKRMDITITCGETTNYTAATTSYYFQ